MRICLLCTEIFAWGKYGGFGRATRTIGRELARRGYEVHAIVPQRQDQKALETLDGIIVHSFPMKRPWEVMSLCREVDADIYHSCEPSMSTWFARRSMPHKQHMVTCRDPRDRNDWWLEFARPSASHLQVVANWINEHNPLVVHSVKRADAVYVPARFLAEKVQDIYHCIQPARFLPTPIPIPEEPIKNKQPTVCFVARLDRRKRPELFCELAQTFPQVRFIVVGKSRDPDYERHLRNQYETLPNLHFEGFVDQFRSDRLSQILSKSWILVNTASREGLPNSFLEAMAHGCAILSMVNPDNVAKDYGFHADKDNFQEGLTWLLGDDRWKTLGEKARRSVCEVFSPQAAMQQHLAAYRKLLNKRAVQKQSLAATGPDGLNLLMVSYEYPPLGGGGAKVVHTLARELSKRRLNLDIVTMRAAQQDQIPELPGVTVTGIPCYRSNPGVCLAHEMVPYLVLALPCLIARARSGRYNLNHTHFIFPDGVLAYLVYRLTGLPYVLTAHGSDVPGYNPDRFSLMHKLLLPAWRQIVNSAHAVICPSQYLDSLIRESSPQARTVVIPNGIDIARFQADRASDGSILVITRMFERKGVQFLIQALAGWSNHPPVHIVGDGPYLPTLKQMADELGVQVTFHGYVDNHSDSFRNLLETAQYFVFTSSAENFPIVLLEAMVAGLAIVTTNDTGCAEAVGDAALLVPPENAEAIREALQQLIGDPDLTATLQQRARDRVVAHYGQDAVTQAHLALYEEARRTD